MMECHAIVFPAIGAFSCLYLTFCSTAFLTKENPWFARIAGLVLAPTFAFLFLAFCFVIGMRLQ